MRSWPEIAELTERPDLESEIERLSGEVFDLKASLGCLLRLMEDDIQTGKVRGTMVRAAVMQEARNLCSLRSRQAGGGDE